MPNKIFSPKYNPVERVAFDMALALASKIESVHTPAQLMAEIAALYPECYKAADNQRKRITRQIAFGRIMLPIPGEFTA